MVITAETLRKLEDITPAWNYFCDKYQRATDTKVDYKELARDMMEKWEEYQFDLRYEYTAEIILCADDLDIGDWESLLVDYSAFEVIGPYRGWKLTAKEVEALKELRKISTEFTADIDMLLNDSIVEE